jgi:hypothetical protein
MQILVEQVILKERFFALGGLLSIQDTRKFSSRPSIETEFRRERNLGMEIRCCFY